METTKKITATAAAGATAMNKALAEIMEAKNCSKDAAMSFLAAFWFDAQSKINAVMSSEIGKNSPKASVSMKLDRYFAAIEDYNKANKSSKLHYGSVATIAKLTGCVATARMVNGKAVGVSIPQYLENNAEILAAKFKHTVPVTEQKSNEGNEQRKKQAEKIKEILLAAGLGSLFAQLND